MRAVCHGFWTRTKKCIGNQQMYKNGRVRRAHVCVRRANAHVRADIVVVSGDNEHFSTGTAVVRAGNALFSRANEHFRGAKALERRGFRLSRDGDEHVNAGNALNRSANACARPANELFYAVTAPADGEMVLSEVGMERSGAGMEVFAENVYMHKSGADSRPSGGSVSPCEGDSVFNGGHCLPGRRQLGGRDDGTTGGDYGDPTSL